jgi:hypothetical protein
MIELRRLKYRCRSSQSFQWKSACHTLAPGQPAIPRSRTTPNAPNAPTGSANDGRHCSASTACLACWPRETEPRPIGSNCCPEDRLVPDRAPDLHWPGRLATPHSATVLASAVPVELRAVGRRRHRRSPSIPAHRDAGYCRDLGSVRQRRDGLGGAVADRATVLGIRDCGVVTLPVTSRWHDRDSAHWVVIRMVGQVRGAIPPTAPLFEHNPADAALQRSPKVTRSPGRYAPSLTDSQPRSGARPRSGQAEQITVSPSQRASIVCCVLCRRSSSSIKLRESRVGRPFRMAARAWSCTDFSR